jgi:hypothetical protein
VLDHSFGFSRCLTTLTNWGHPLRSISTVYHLVDARNWASVQTNGLLSARRILERTYPGGSEDAAHWRQHRPDTIVLPDGLVVRDQRPMPPMALVRCLGHGITPADWYEHLNGKIFFWLDPKRLNRHRGACGETEQLVLTIDAVRLLKRYGGVASVSPINSGNARRAAAWRSATTFVAYDRWVANGWADEQRPGIKSRPNGHRPVELVVDDEAPDIMAYVAAVTRLKAGESFNP